MGMDDKQAASAINTRRHVLDLLAAKLPELFAAGFGSLTIRVDIYDGVAKYVTDTAEIRRPMDVGRR